MASACLTSTMLRRATTLKRPLPNHPPSPRRRHGHADSGRFVAPRQSPSSSSVAADAAPGSPQAYAGLFLGALVGVPALLVYGDYADMRERVERIGGRLRRVSSRWL